MKTAPNESDSLDNSWHHICTVAFFLHHSSATFRFLSSNLPISSVFQITPVVIFTQLVKKSILSLDHCNHRKNTLAASNSSAQFKQIEKIKKKWVQSQFSISLELRRNVCECHLYPLTKRDLVSLSPTLKISKACSKIFPDTKKLFCQMVLSAWQWNIWRLTASASSQPTTNKTLRPESLTSKSFQKITKVKFRRNAKRSGDISERSALDNPWPD